MKDYLIIGQGLAGSILAAECLQQGYSITVADPSTGHNASGVAGGIFNPITGKRWVRTWGDAWLLPYAADYYSAFDAETGAGIYHPMPIARLFRDQEDRDQFDKRSGADPVYANYVAAELSAAQLPAGVLAPHGAVILRGGGYVDTGAVCRTIRKELEGDGLLKQTNIPYEDLTVHDDQVLWGGDAYRHVVFCEGYSVSGNPWFDSIPYRHAKGEILTVRIPELSQEQIISAGIFMCPLGEGLFRVGATYEWQELNSEPTEAGKKDLLEKLSAICSLNCEVVDHRAGVRPIAFDRAPVAGRSPEHKALVIFNGFGSKGVLYAPYYARALVDHLEHGEPIDPKVSVQTHWKPERVKKNK